MSQSVRYVIERKLSEGGMAEVFLARQGCLEGFEKRVVLKSVLPRHADSEEFVRMLLNEARLAAKLDHPNLVQVVDLTELDGRHYIVMEYLEGENLRSIQKRAHERNTRLSLGVACRIIADVLAGLAYAHAQEDDQGKPLGLVHRDVSPPNILCTFNGTIKLIDFGIAKATLQANADVTAAGQFKGKCAYMAPEQIRCRAVDARTDVFAAGIVLWELLTGKRLFGGMSEVESMVAIVNESAPPPSSVIPGLPPEIDEILARALARSADDRYASASEMRRDLEALMRQQHWASNAMTVEQELLALFKPAELFDDGPTTATPPRDELPADDLAAGEPPPVSIEMVAGEPSVELELDALAEMSQPSGSRHTLYDDWPVDARSGSVVRTRRWRRAIAAALALFVLGGLGSAVVRYYDRVPGFMSQHAHR
jgi:eukaryotic-like serine/threonine-protein kinase